VSLSHPNDYAELSLMDIKSMCVGEDGNLTVWPFQTIILTKEMQFNKLTIWPFGKVKTKGYRVFVQNGLNLRFAWFSYFGR
jgi:hypothetical protein